MGRIGRQIAECLTVTEHHGTPLIPLTPRPLSGDRPEQWTRGEGNEWSPVMLSDGQTFGYLASDATHPARAVVSDFAAKSKPPLAPETWPKDFPSDRMVVPQQAVFQ